MTLLLHPWGTPNAGTSSDDGREHAVVDRARRRSSGRPSGRRDGVEVGRKKTSDETFVRRADAGAAGAVRLKFGVTGPAGASRCTPPRPRRTPASAAPTSSPRPGPRPPSARSGSVRTPTSTPRGRRRSRRPASAYPSWLIWLLRSSRGRASRGPTSHLPSIPWPDLPSIPWPDIRLPAIPWPDVTCRTCRRGSTPCGKLRRPDPDRVLHRAGRGQAPAQGRGERRH